MNGSVFDSLFCMNEFAKVRNTYGNMDRMDMAPYIWVLFVMHKRIERLEGKLGITESIELPESTEELSLLQRDFLRTWEGDKLLGLNPAKPLPENLDELRDEFVAFFEAIILPRQSHLRGSIFRG